MLYSNVLVPYDESDHARSALHAAFGLVGTDPEARVHALTVIPAGTLPSPALLGDGVGPAYATLNPTSYEQIMNTVVERARAEVEQAIAETRDDARCQVSAQAVISTSPVDGIVEYVERHGIDLVVMGRRGLGALRGMLGSVSFGVLRSVDVPVLTVK